MYLRNLLLLLALFLAASSYILAEEPAFQSKLFSKGTLVQSDDFDQGKYKGRYGPNKKNIQQLDDGTLEVLPVSGKPGELTVFHVYNTPPKFVCHLRFKLVCSDPTGGVAIQIGGHKMHLGSNAEGYSLFLRNARKTFKNTEVKGFGANKWIDMVIEYEEGKMLLNINGSEKIYEHEGINMDGAKSILFKYRKVDKTLIDYVRLWKVAE